jgi:hypothetical protein
MRSIFRTIILIIVFGFLYGQKDNNEKLPLILTVTPLKTSFKISEKWEYEIRIANISNDTLRIPREIEEHYYPRMIASNGEHVKWEYAISAMGNFDEKNTIELCPGCFFGKTCTWIGLEHPGTYAFSVVYYAPTNSSDSLPDYWSGQLESNEVQVKVE